MKRKSNTAKLKKALEQLATGAHDGNIKLKARAGKIVREENIKENKAIHRSLLIQMGLYGVHKEKVFKDKKTYSRKSKHNKPDQNQE